MEENNNGFLCPSRGYHVVGIYRLHFEWVNYRRYSSQDVWEMKYRICACISCTFLTRIYPPKLGCGLCTEYYSFWRLSPRRRYCMFWNSQWRPLMFETFTMQATAHTQMRQRIGIFWLHESSQYHQFPEVGRLWHHWQITTNAASNNQSAANAIANILLSHR
jgi:hypothetical protein